LKEAFFTKHIEDLRISLRNNTMGKTFFSIITPVYNIEHLIAGTIQSVLDQTFGDWEMICVDDGSPDKAGLICDEYAKKDSRIKVIHKKNAGLAAARNSGIRVATGTYFIILEGSDLFFDSNTLQHIHDDLRSYPVDIYFGLLQDKMEKTGEITNVQADYSVNGLWDKGGVSLVCHLYDNNDILALSSPVNKVFRRNFVIENDLWFYEGIYHDDDEWIPRAIAHTTQTYFTNRIIYNALNWDGCFGGNVSEKGLTKKAVDKMLIAEHCCKYFANHFPEEKELLRKINTYFSRMYIDGITALNRVKNTDLRRDISRAAYKHSIVFRYMRNSESNNLRLVSYLSKIIGLPMTFRIIQLRYK